MNNPNSNAVLPDQDRPDMQPTVPVEEYLGRVLQLATECAAAGVGRPVETFPLQQCLGRTLAEDVFADVPIPNFANSAMDGYAVRWEDLDRLPAWLHIVGEQPAGRARDLRVGVGEAARIMTGAPVPAGADTVVPSELTTEVSCDEGLFVTVQEGVGEGANVRMKGEDAQVGDRVLQVGDVLTARHLSAAAAIGRGELKTYRPLQVGVLSTGDELVPPGQDLAPGQIYESNSTLLVGLVQTMGMVPHYRAASGDDPAALEAALTDLTARTDAVLLTGGVSVGRFDVVRALLQATGTGHFQRVAMQPGKPQGYGSWQGVPLLAFPGNPVSAFVSFHVFGRPFLRQLQGTRPADAVKRWAVAGAGWKCPSGRRQYLTAYLEAGPGPLPLVLPTSRRGSGSHLVTTLARAEVLAVVPAGTDRVEEGDTVEIQEVL